MDFMELLTVLLGATATASVLYAGMALRGRENLTSLDTDMVTLVAVAMFVSMMVARHPEWMS